VGRQKGEEEARQTLEDISLLPIRLTEVSKQAVLDAATYKMRFPISYADAFALALTNSVEGKLLTGDPELIKLDQFVAMEQLDRLNP
jgi:predicted nucleic acid-binding protein